MDLKNEFGRLAVVLVVAGNLAISIVISSFIVFDEGRLVGVVPRGLDNHPYLSMYAGKPLKSAPWNYRIVVPYLARHIPDIPVHWMFQKGRNFTPASQAGIKFALLNLLFLVGTAIVLYYLIIGLGLSGLHGLAGGVLYLSLQELGAFSGQPMIEPTYFFFMVLSALAIQRQNSWLLMATTLIGVFVKEQMLLAIGLVVLAPYTWRQRCKLLLAILPAIALYGMVRFWFFPLEQDTLAPGTLMSFYPVIAQFLTSPTGVFRFLMTFGLLWVPIIYALARCSLPPLLQRWAWFIPLVFISTILLGGGYEVHGMSRHLSVSFIAAVPLALCGLSSWLGYKTKYLQ